MMNFHARYSTQDISQCRLAIELLLAFVSTVIPGFSLLEIRDQHFCSLLHMYVFRNRAPSSTRGAVGLSM
jgi:hypothetical protein